MEWLNKLFANMPEDAQNAILFLIGWGASAILVPYISVTLTVFIILFVIVFLEAINNLYFRKNGKVENLLWVCAGSVIPILIHALA